MPCPHNHISTTNSFVAIFLLLILLNELTGVEPRYGRSPSGDATPVRRPVVLIDLERLFLPHGVPGEHVDGMVLQPELAIQIVMQGIVLLPRANVVRPPDVVTALHLLLGGRRGLQDRSVEGAKDEVEMTVPTTLGLLGGVFHLLLHLELLGFGTIFVKGWGRRVVRRRSRSRSGQGGGRGWSPAERTRGDSR